MGDDLDLFDNAFGVGRDTFPFVFDDQSFLKSRIMGGDAGGAGVLVAFQRLNAPQREHPVSRLMFAAWRPFGNSVLEAGVRPDFRPLSYLTCDPSSD